MKSCTDKMIEDLEDEELVAQLHVANAVLRVEEAENSLLEAKAFLWEHVKRLKLIRKDLELARRTKSEQSK